MLLYKKLLLVTFGTTLVNVTATCFGCACIPFPLPVCSVADFIVERACSAKTLLYLQHGVSDCMF